jgi:hypothetical protein
MVKFILENKTAIVLGAGWLGSAFVSTLPDQRPKTLDDMWAWGKEFIHQVGNAKRPTQPKP